jgi:hypothetical protein
MRSGPTLRIDEPVGAEWRPAVGQFIGTARASSLCELAQAFADGVLVSESDVVARVGPGGELCGGHLESCTRGTCCW